MKKKQIHKKPINQIKIDFNCDVNNGGEKNQQNNSAKIIALDFRSHIYRSILKRKMQ